ncbi:MAG: hypothetical protein ACREJG_08210, partial [Candidatus Rokuibacteriota bacterium]
MRTLCRRRMAVAVAVSMALVVGATAGSVRSAPARGFPDAASLDAFRGTVQGLLAWPTAVRVRLSQGEVRSRGVAYTFDLEAETTPGGLALTLTLASARGGPPLT